jgi:hypothetical protein
MAQSWSVLIRISIVSSDESFCWISTDVSVQIFIPKHVSLRQTNSPLSMSAPSAVGTKNVREVRELQFAKDGSKYAGQALEGYSGTLPYGSVDRKATRSMSCQLRFLIRISCLHFLSPPATV